MKKHKVIILAIILTCVCISIIGLLVLRMFTHKHSWENASCTTPKICSKCGETEGEANGHSWKNATCTTPKTCVICKETEGEAKGHSWKNATCTTPKTCTICMETEGKDDGCIAARDPYGDHS